MKRTFLFLTGLLFGLSIVDVHAQSIRNFVDPIRLRNEMERNVKLMNLEVGMTAPDSLKREFQRRKRAVLWTTATREQQRHDTLHFENQDTLMSANYIRALVQRAVSVDERIFMDSTVTYRRGDIPDSKSVYSYDANGNQVCRITYRSDGYSWIPETKTEKVYKENGNTLLSAFWYWDDESSWIGSYKYEYDYDEYGNRILEAYYSGWDDEISDWRGSYKYEYLYVDGQRVMTSNLSGWDISTHTFSYGSRTEYVYDDSGRQISRVYSTWRPENNCFVFRYRQENGYDDYGNLTLEAEYDYDLSLGDWVGAYKYEYAFKDGKSYYRTLYAYYNEWDPETAEWIGAQKYEYDFDATGNITLDSYSKWDSETGGWVESRRTEKVFGEDGKLQTGYSHYQWDYVLGRLCGLERWTSLYNEDDDLTLHEVFQWDAEADEWILTDKYEYEYAYNEYGNPVTSTAIHNGVLYGKTEYTYTDRQSLLSSVSYIQENETWVASSMMERTYDDLNRVTGERTYTAVTDGSWQNETMQEWEWTGWSYSYISMWASYTWDTAGEFWCGKEKYERDKDPNTWNDLSYMRYSGWTQETGWIGVSGYEYAYAWNGLQTLNIQYQGWDHENNCWRDGTKEEYSYDVYGYRTQLLSSTWDSSVAEWVYAYKTVSGRDDALRQILTEEWQYDTSLQKWIGSYKQEYAYDDNGNRTLEALYDGWDTEGDCWRGSYKQEYSYKENWSSNAWYNGWDYTNHTWIGAEKTETVTEYSEKGYVRQDIQSEWDMDSLDWSLAYKNEDAYIYVNDTVYYGDDNYYINTRSYKVYTSQYKGDGGLWFGESKTEYQYDEAMRKKAEVYYQGMISETEWQPHERCEYEYDMYDNISVENRLSYNMYDDLWVLENTTKYYYTKGVNVLDESEWILLRDIYADLSRRNGWKRQWYDCSNINSVYSWSGVTRSDGHVTKIDISGFKLGGSFPYRLFTLPYLQEINISNNHFTGDLSVEFTDSIDSNHISVKNISTLYMANNGFEGNVSGFVYYLPSLKTLNLSGNRFSDVYPELPMSINSLNIGKQKIDRTLELHLSHPDLESIIADIPSIILYDHASQSYSPYIDLMCRTKNNEIGQSDWFIQMTIDNGIVTFPNVSYDNAYRGKSGDTLDVEALEDGSSFKLKLDFDSGDANLTDDVDAADLQATVLYAFNAYQYRPFNFTAADTYKDGNINVQDVVCTVNILLGQIDRLAYVTRKAQSINADEAAAVIYMRDGHIILHSERPVAAITVSSYGNVEWHIDKYGLQQAMAGGNVVGYSLTGVVLPAGETIIGTYTGDAGVTYASLADPEAWSISVSTDKNGTTDVERVNTSIDEDATVYDVMGRRLDSPGKGVNIIRKDGRTIKVVNGVNR